MKKRRRVYNIRGYKAVSDVLYGRLICMITYVYNMIYVVPKVVVDSPKRGGVN